MVIKKQTKTTKKPIILCLVKFYLPGFKSGGPVRSISNFVEQFGNQYSIRIITSDRDVFDKHPYSMKKIDNWNNIGKAKVFYASKQSKSYIALLKLIKKTPFDFLYLNTFFDVSFAIFPILINKFNLSDSKQIVLAPRGELSKGALSIKRFKKKVFLSIFKKLDFYKKILWQASNYEEVKDIKRELNVEKRCIFIAPNLTGIPSKKIHLSKKGILKKNSIFKIIFLSRISPKKNLHFLLKILQEIDVKISLKIYGIIDDELYWKNCKRLIKKLPPKIKVSYEGAINHDLVKTKLNESDLFILPTKGENFGHAIFESLMAGTPVLISNKTPWKNNLGNGIQAINLSNKKKWILALNYWTKLSKEKIIDYKIASHNYALNYNINSDTYKMNEKLFWHAYKISKN